MEITKRIQELISGREFISIATCNFHGRPNVAPKFFLKSENNFIYLVDYVIGATYKNLKINPQVSMSLMDLDNLLGYQINGTVEIIEKGNDYDGLLSEFQAKEISLSTKRIIEGLDRGKKHTSFEVGFSEKVAVFKVKMIEIVEIGLTGDVKREKV